METNRLANFFNRQREIIEAAELPFAKMAIFILPILAPLVPAFITGLHIYQLLLEIFTFPGSVILAAILALVVGVVLEMLGYVGAISFIKSLFDWVRSREDSYILPFALNGLAYIFYLVAMYLINVQLGSYFGTPEIVNKIFGLLSFITVPTGLLAANHLSTKEVKEDDNRTRNENREYKLKRKALDKGINIFSNTNQYQQYQSGVSRVEKRKSDWRLLTPEEKYEVVHILTPEQIRQKYPVSRSASFEWKKKNLD